MKKNVIVRRERTGWLVEDVYEPGDFQPGWTVATLIDDVHWLGDVRVGMQAVSAGCMFDPPKFRAVAA